MIGIITAPNVKQDLDCGQSQLKLAYFHWIEMADEQAMIIPYDISEDDLLIILQRIQGIVWVGGEIENTKTHTTKQYTTLLNTLFYCYQYAIRENNNGNYYPIWGTCLGFDILLMFANQKSSLKESLLSSIQPSHNIFLINSIFVSFICKIRSDSKIFIPIDAVAVSHITII